MITASLVLFLLLSIVPGLELRTATDLGFVWAGGGTESTSVLGEQPNTHTEVN